MNTAQKIFGMSYTNTYIFVGVFLLFVVGIIATQIVINHFHKKWVAYLTFSTIFLAIIITLPFEAKVNYAAWGWNGNYSMWYAQIMQFTIVIGNIYMIFLVIFLLIALFFNIIKTMFEVVQNSDYVRFFKSLGIFLFISISMLLLINLYRVFPLYNYDMNNDPTVGFVGYGSPIGIKNFDGQGFWPFFITNFLIAYFFTGNYDISYNGNAHYVAGTTMVNPVLPVQVPIVLSLFSAAFIIGIILGFVYKEKSADQYLKVANKISRFNNKSLNAVYACLPVASLSFFSESLLQSQIGTWMHLTFVFVIMIIAWTVFYLVSAIFVMQSYHLSMKDYFQIAIRYLHTAFKRNNLNADEFKIAENNINQYIVKSKQRSIDVEISETYQRVSFIAETVVFPLALIGYLSFMPGGGYTFTSNVNCAGYWFAMFFGSFFCFVGGYGISGLATVGQNMQASCAFNIMCGTNTGIFGPFGFIMNKFRVQIDLNFLFALFAVRYRQELRSFKKLGNEVSKTEVAKE